MPEAAAESRLVLVASLLGHLTRALGSKQRSILLRLPPPDLALRRKAARGCSD
jgi:hypothetical protein